jgi:hypothetical protein
VGIDYDVQVNIGIGDRDCQMCAVRNKETYEVVILRRVKVEEGETDCDYRLLTLSLGCSDRRIVK